MITFTSSGSFKRTETFLAALLRNDVQSQLSKYGQEGVAALSQATPKDSGKAASSWSYKITKTRRGYELAWLNDNVENGAKVVLLIQYGHGTSGGGYVQGRDFINPAIKPIFEKIERDIWRVVNTA
jgi:hypothetical protein